MQVNVFVTHIDGKPQRQLLVLPQAPDAAIPEQYRRDWNYYATVDTLDRMFGNIDARTIEAEIAKAGFALVTPTLPDRR